MGGWVGYLDGGFDSLWDTLVLAYSAGVEVLEDVLLVHVAAFHL